MVRSRNFLILLAVLFMVQGCWLEEEDATSYFFSSYVMAYQLEPMGVQAKVKDKKIYLCPQFERSVSYLSEGEDYVRYEELCEEMGDVHYNRVVKLNPAGFPMTPELGVSFSPDIVSLQVVSDCEFDASHPAGSSLNDCVSIAYTSLAPYVASGYKENHLRESVVNLNELNTGNLNLLGKMNDSYLVLSFNRLPTETSCHNLTITVAFEDSQEYQCVVEYEF